MTQYAYTSLPEMSSYSVSFGNLYNERMYIHTGQLHSQLNFMLYCVTTWTCSHVHELLKHTYT